MTSSGQWALSRGCTWPLGVEELVSTVTQRPLPLPQGPGRCVAMMEADDENSLDPASPPWEVAGSAADLV